jgi:hypothetical protein
MGSACREMLPSIMKRYFAVLMRSPLAQSRSNRCAFWPPSWSASSISADTRKALTVGAVTRGTWRPSAQPSGGAAWRLARVGLSGMARVGLRPRPPVHRLPQRLTVMHEWVWVYCTRNISARLITGDMDAPTWKGRKSETTTKLVA